MKYLKALKELQIRYVDEGQKFREWQYWTWTIDHHLRMQFVQHLKKSTHMPRTAFYCLRMYSNEFLITDTDER